MIEFTIKTLDSINHHFSVSDEITVEQLKAIVRDQMGIEPDLQRLIFCGRVLQDEKLLAEYDVAGKVVHLVQRAPPVLEPREPRSSSTSRHASRSGRQLHPNATFNGPAEDGEPPLGFHHEMRRLMNLAGTPDFVLDHNQQMSLSPTAGRLEAVRRLIAEIKTSLGCLQAHLAGEENSGGPASSQTPVETMDNEDTPAAPAEEPEPNFDENGEEVTSDSSPRPPNARRRVARMMRTRHTQPRHLAGLIDELEYLNDQFQVHRSNYARLLRAANEPQPPVYTEEERERNQTTVEMTTDLMHSFAHAYHALSDITYTVGNTRLAAEPAVTRHIIPMQAHINVISTARRPPFNTTTTSGSNAMGSGTSSHTSSSATPNSDASGDNQTGRPNSQNDLESLFRGISNGLGGVEVVMSMEEIPQGALGNLGNLASGNAGGPSLPSGFDGGVYVAPMAAFAAGGPPNADLLQSILSQVIRQGHQILVDAGHPQGLNDGLTLNPQNAQPAQSMHNVPSQRQPTTTDSEAQTVLSGVDRSLALGPLHEDDDEDDDEVVEDDDDEETDPDSSTRERSEREKLERQRLDAISALEEERRRRMQDQVQFESALNAVAEQTLALGRVQTHTRRLVSELRIRNAALRAQAVQPASQTPQEMQRGSSQPSSQPQASAPTQPQPRDHQAQAPTQPQPTPQSQAPQQLSQTAQILANDARQALGNNPLRRQNQAQAMALAHMFYDRFLQCDSIHARRRLQRRRTQQQQLLDQREHQRNERAAQQNYETLAFRRPDIRPINMIHIMTVLNGNPCPPAWLIAFLVGVSRQLYLNELLHASNGMPALLPHEFQSLRTIVRNYVHHLLARVGVDDSDNAFQSVSDHLVDTYATFISNLDFLTPMRREIDVLESIRALVRSRLPAFIASVMCESSTDQFVARFYAMFLRLFTEMCSLVHHMCTEGERGLRLILRKFLATVVADYDETDQAAILALGMDNLAGVVPNVCATFESVAQFIRRTDGSMLELPSRHSPTPVEIGEPPRAENMQTPPPVIPATQAQAPSSDAATASDNVSRHINITNTNRDAPAQSAATSSGSSDRSGESSPTRPVFRFGTGNAPERESSIRPTPISPTSDSNFRFVPPMMIVQHWGEEWVPVFTTDQQSQSVAQQRPAEPYSDGYLTGMTSRKRRCVRQARPPTTLDGFMNESVREATERMNTDNQAIRTAFREHMRSMALTRANNSADYDPTRHASAARFVNGLDPARSNKTDKSETNNQENGV